MDVTAAKRVGRSKTVYAALIALLSAYLMMAAITGDGSWLFSEKSIVLNILAGGLFVLIAAFFIGPFSGVSILVKKRNCYWVSIRNSFIILWMGVIPAACIGFVQEGVNEFPIWLGLDDYIIKPLAMTTIFGGIPLIIIAAITGYLIKRTDADKKGK